MAHKDLKALRKNQKLVHNKETAEILTETDKIQHQAGHKSEYKATSRLRWFDWLISAIILLVGIGMSFLVGYLTLKSKQTPNWWGASYFAFAYLFVLILIWWMLGYWKNKAAEKYFNDKRRRYQKTYTLEEAKYRRFRNLILVSWLPFALFATLITILL
ncbi:hypothetical protein JN01_0226 [Entomoplasma freundtii]|uniref:Uncharacterized protein n=1 Tax=Entomoplasma freundtii TaxID=74700 RepID=A0A2K8NVA1_9MOLU|nr:hypothetical protein [Entomoplasma freundtii]ATZ16563.1 hypothetical protein EFREU_v1c05420 [Entomoplasma freundtii]TDY58271.1 hypothetical protein JN01_0226 [Entomoplasma freundtii]